MGKTTECIIRPMRRDEVPLLRSFLYEAIFIPEGVEPPPPDVVDLPELSVYIENFGQRTDDYCLVADCGGRVVGAVWVRIMNDYGHVDDETPSLSIALYKAFRKKGIGSQLLVEMLDFLRCKGYRCVSLSVQKDNYAVGMYLKQGFKTVKETTEEFIMIKNLEKNTGSVVVKSVPAGFVAVGNPCRVIRRVEPVFTLRPLDERDATAMMVLFRSTVLTVNRKDYTLEEAEDWASCGSNEERWKYLLSVHRFVGAFCESGELVGFSSMNAEGYMHSLFVHKNWQGQGVATCLLAKVEKMAEEYGVAEITAEVSLTARPFFERKGYEVVKVQKCRANRLELTNFVMRKCR